jgi:hypothetical protein
LAKAVVSAMREEIVSTTVDPRKKAPQNSKTP